MFPKHLMLVMVHTRYKNLETIISIHLYYFENNLKIYIDISFPKCTVLQQHLFQTLNDKQ